MMNSLFMDTFKKNYSFTNKTKLGKMKNIQSHSSLKFSHLKKKLNYNEKYVTPNN